MYGATVNDSLLIDQYDEHHKALEIIDSIKDKWIHDMQIFHVATDFMIIEVQDGFSFEKKQNGPSKSLCHQMEELMSTYQKTLSIAEPGESGY